MQLGMGENMESRVAIACMEKYFFYIFQPDCCQKRETWCQNAWKKISGRSDIGNPTPIGSEVPSFMARVQFVREVPEGGFWGGQNYPRLIDHGRFSGGRPYIETRYLLPFRR